MTAGRKFWLSPILPEAGNNLNAPANIIRARVPDQEIGTLRDSVTNRLANFARLLYGFAAVNMPIPVPVVAAMIIAATAKVADGSNLEPIISLTDSPLTRE
jgi:hypothetical protein